MFHPAVWIFLVLICFAAIAFLTRKKMPSCPSCRPLQLFHKLRPQSVFQVKESDSVDERLDRLAEELADKESSCYRSKYKILSAEHEMAQLGDGARKMYRDTLDGLRGELASAEAECRRIQGQIEDMAQRRAELNDEVQLGHRLYGRAVTQLASHLADLQRGRALCRPVPPSHQAPMGHRRSMVECRCKTE